jgi:hypothetical protein
MEDNGNINVQHLRNAVDQLGQITKKHANDLPPELFNDLTNIHNRINEACGWKTTQETSRTAGVGGATGR